MLSALLVAALLAIPAEGVREPAPKPPEAAPQLTKPPVLLEAKPAEYPADKLAAGVQADVACLIDIDATGSVTDVQVEQGAGPDFDAAAVAALKQYRFSPAELDGKPGAVRIRYVYHFVIQQKPKPRVEEEVDGARVTGKILEAGTRRPIAAADVTVDDTDASTTTDADGNFVLDDVPAGARRVRAGSAAFAEGTQRLQLEKRGSAEVTLYLRRKLVGELSATVRGEKPKDAPTRRSLTREELQNVPGSLNDPVRVVQNLPGLARAPFLGGALLVRGSPPADTGIYLDGDKIPLLFHFLGGPSVINEQMLDRIDFYPGGYGAYYGRNLTGAIDVATRGGEEKGFHGSASVDLLQSSVFAETPVGDKTRVAAAARRSYIDLILPLVLPKDTNGSGTTSIVPIYWDYQARVDHQLDGGDALSLLAFGSDDRLTVVRTGGKNDIPISVSAHTAFHRVHGAWKHALGPDLQLQIAPAAGIALQTFDASGVGGGGFAQGQDLRIFDLSAGLRGELRWQARSWLAVRAGVDTLLDRYGVDATLQVGQQVRNLGLPITEPVTLSRVEPFVQLGEYVEAKVDAGRLQLTPGLRIDQLHWFGKTVPTVDPRLWARYQLTETDALKAYAGLYHQPPQPQNVDPQLGNPQLTAERAVQFGVGWERKFGELWNASLELFSNRQSLVVSPVVPEVRNGQLYNPLYDNVGIERAFGAELLVRREISAQLYGWLAYTLSKAQLLRRPGEAWRAFQFDQTHILTLLAGYRPTPGWELSARFRLTSGNPTAPVLSATFDADRGTYLPDRGDFGDARSPLFYQLDLRAQKTWTYDLWQLALYLDVQNVTNHKNEEFHVWDYRYRQDGSISGLPILPTLGVSARF